MTANDETPKVVDLMEALEASLAAIRERRPKDLGGKSEKSEGGGSRENGGGDAKVVESPPTVPAPTSADLDVEAIRARCEAAESAPAWPAGPFVDAWVRNARDVPALLDEIVRLRADLRIANEASAELLHQAAAIKAEYNASEHHWRLQWQAAMLREATLKDERDRLHELVDEGRAVVDDLREALQAAADDLQALRDRVSALEAGRWT